MVINMFANDLQMPIEYFNKFAETKNVDIYIDLYGEDDVYNASSVEMIWPHYQNRYCLIYANTLIFPSDNVMSMTNIHMIFAFIVSIICLIFFYIVFRYR